MHAHSVVFRVSAVCVAAILVAGCGRHRTTPLPANIPATSAPEQTAFALRYADLNVGAGAPVVARQCVYVHYTGWLINGTTFDSSRDTLPNGQPKAPLTVPLGIRRVIAGWDLGFDGMRVGGQRRLFIPYQLAYGEAGRPPVIPAKSELIFDVELMAATDTLPRVATPVDSTVRRPATPPAPQCPTWATVSAGTP